MRNRKRVVPDCYWPRGRERLRDFAQVLFRDFGSVLPERSRPAELPSAYLFHASNITATGFLQGYRWGKPEFKKTPPARRQGQNRISLRLKIVHRNSPPFLSGERFFRLVLRVGFGFVLGLWRKRGILGRKAPPDYWRGETTRTSFF